MSSTETSSAPTVISLAPATSETTQASPAAPRRLGRNLLIAAVVLGIVAWLADFGWHAYHYEETDDAYIVGHMHQVSPQIDGQVKEVLVADNQPVKAGDVLLRLDPLRYEIAVEKAQADVAQARAKQIGASAALAEAQARVSEAAAQISEIDAQLELARINHERNKVMFGDGKSGVVTQSEIDKSHSTLAVTRASAEAASASLAAAQAAQQSASAQIEASAAAVAAAGAELRDARRQLADTVLTAPSDGRIGNKSVETGDQVKSGQTLFALAEPDPWIIANFKETQLARMHPGQSVELTIDALPGATLRGTIDSLAPASGAQFALLPADNATGNFNKVVRRVPVKIVLDADSRALAGDRLSLGFSAIVNVRVR
ncbi:MAG TPA: HlyD family secretion protein [Opitutaceae bacterium]|nr:HlyD family secretion protein [Opitutaceae bacterium]